VFCLNTRFFRRKRYSRLCTREADLLLKRYKRYKRYRPYPRNNAETPNRMTPSLIVLHSVVLSDLHKRSKPFHKSTPLITVEVLTGRQKKESKDTGLAQVHTMLREIWYLKLPFIRRPALHKRRMKIAHKRLSKIHNVVHLRYTAYLNCTAGGLVHPAPIRRNRYLGAPAGFASHRPVIYQGVVTRLNVPQPQPGVRP
jgi:hypothetical protein